MKDRDGEPVDGEEGAEQCREVGTEEEYRQADAGPAADQAQCIPEQRVIKAALIHEEVAGVEARVHERAREWNRDRVIAHAVVIRIDGERSEEHTSELQSQF